MAEMNFDYVIGKARALKAKMKEVTDRHEAELQPFKDMKVKLESILLDMLNKTGQQNSSTPSGGVHKKSRVTYSVEDADEFMRHVIGTESWELINRSVNDTAAEDFLAQHQMLPPGVKRSEMITVGLTAPVKTRKRAPAPPTSESNDPPEMVAVRDALWAQAEADADAALAAEAQEATE